MFTFEKCTQTGSDSVHTFSADCLVILCAFSKVNKLPYNTTTVKYVHNTYVRFGPVPSISHPNIYLFISIYHISYFLEYKYIQCLNISFDEGWRVWHSRISNLYWKILCLHFLSENNLEKKTKNNYLKQPLQLVARTLG